MYSYPQTNQRYLWETMKYNGHNKGRKRCVFSLLK